MVKVVVTVHAVEMRRKDSERNGCGVCIEQFSRLLYWLVVIMMVVVVMITIY